MAKLDILILIVVAVGAFMGWRMGLLKQLGRLFALVGAIIGCRLFGQWLSDVIGYPWIGYPIVGIIVFFVVIYLSKGLKTMLKAVKLGILDKAAGAAFNLFEYAFIASFLLNIWVMVYPQSDIFNDNNTKILNEKILSLAPAVIGSKQVQELYHTTVDWVPSQKTTDPNGSGGSNGNKH